MSNRPAARPTSSARFAHPAPRADAAGSRRRLWIVVAVATAVVAALVVAVAVTAASKGGEGGETLASGATVVPAGDRVTGVVHETGAPLPAFTGGPTDGAAGQAAPRLDGEQFDGAGIRLPADGRPAVITFLAHWCPHCQKEVPLLARWLDQTGLPGDVDLWAVATGIDRTRPNFPPGEWLRRERWPVPTLVDDARGTAANAYGLSGFPFFVAVGSDGRVVQRVSGELTVEQFQSLIDAARTGQPDAGLGTSGPASGR